jgi:uncharacterized repeat protein (TIGR01451 family)
MLEKIGTDSYVAGQPFRYTIVVRNTAGAPLTQVRVQEELPAGARCVAVEPQASQDGQRLTWDLGNLEPREERRLSIQVQPAGEGEFQSVASASSMAWSTWRTRITRPQLTVTKKCPATAQVGDKVPFEIVVSNPGSGPANNVIIHDTMPPGLQHPQGTDIEADLGTLAPGQSRTINLETTAVKAGHHVNVVSVTADDGLQARDQAEVRITEPGLLVRKTGPEKACLHHEMGFKLEVANNGEAPATSVRLIDSLPDGLDYVSASDGAAHDPNSRSVEWQLGTLQPGQSRIVSVQLRARTAGDWINKATARADRGLEKTAEATVHVEGVPALLLEVVDIDDPLEVGAETDYEIRVNNQGTSPVTGIAIRGVLPAGLDFVRAEGPTSAHQHDREVVYEPLPKLAAKADAVYRIRVKAMQPGDWRFQAYLTSDSLTKPVLEEESTLVYDDSTVPSTGQTAPK